MCIRDRRTNEFNAAVDTTNVSEYFEEIDSSNYWRDLSQSLLKPNEKTSSARPYFKHLASNLELTKFFTKEQIQEIILNLTHSDHPYLEKTGVFILYKEWPDKLEHLTDLSKKIGIANKELAEGGSKTDYPYNRILNLSLIHI